ncbi:hypothetical protein GF324_04055 [bacterium]|nr:hypothetical protein [bacterium]
MSGVVTRVRAGMPSVPVRSDGREHSTHVNKPVPVSTVSPRPTAPTTISSNWATAGGPALYDKVQRLPDEGISGNAERVSSDPEKAKGQGVGRRVDTYA